MRADSLIETVFDKRFVLVKRGRKEHLRQYAKAIKSPRAISLFEIFWLRNFSDYLDLV